jgi:hypothetical protein
LAEREFKSRSKPTYRCRPLGFERIGVIDREPFDFGKASCGPKTA